RSGGPRARRVARGSRRLARAPCGDGAAGRGGRRRGTAGTGDREACGDVAMRLSTKGRYAVMAMVDLAKHSGGEPVSLAEIAERQEISLSYLEQLFAMLRKNGLVKSVRGPGGGYLLA